MYIEKLEIKTVTVISLRLILGVEGSIASRTKRKVEFITVHLFSKPCTVFYWTNLFIFYFIKSVLLSKAQLSVFGFNSFVKKKWPTALIEHGWFRKFY